MKIYMGAKAHMPEWFDTFHEVNAKLRPTHISIETDDETLEWER